MSILWCKCQIWARSCIGKFSSFFFFFTAVYIIATIGSNNQIFHSFQYCYKWTVLYRPPQCCAYRVFYTCGWNNFSKTFIGHIERWQSEMTWRSPPSPAPESSTCNLPIVLSRKRCPNLVNQLGLSVSDILTGYLLNHTSHIIHSIAIRVVRGQTLGPEKLLDNHFPVFPAVWHGAKSCFHT